MASRVEHQGQSESYDSGENPRILRTRASCPKQIIAL